MYTLKPHQIIGRDTLAARGQVDSAFVPHFLLADEQRVGKCAQSLTAASKMGARRVAVLCKAIGRDNWYEQNTIWTPGEFQLWVESYNRFTVNADTRAQLRRFKPDILILDEAQALRNQDAQITKLIYGNDCEGTGYCALPDVVWPMSGTINANNNGELWTHFRALWEWDMDYYEHIDRYTRWTMGDYGPRFFGNRPDTLPEIQRFLKKMSLRRLFKDVNPQSGAPIWNPVVLTPKSALGKIHHQERDPAVKRLLERYASGEAFDEEPEPLAALRRLTGMAKVPLIAEHIRDTLAEGRRHVLVGALHHDVLDGLKKALHDLRVVQLDGRTSRAQRNVIQRRWLAGDYDVLLGQLVACGTSIDLSRADCVVLAESSWEEDVNWQFVFRALNLMKSEALPVDVLGLAGSSDEGVARVNVRKGIQSTETWEHAA